MKFQVKFWSMYQKFKILLKVNLDLNHKIVYCQN
jgi:hypothetical protein